jgi:hypothetical protein
MPHFQETRRDEARSFGTDIEKSGTGLKGPESGPGRDSP